MPAADAPVAALAVGVLLRCADASSDGLSQLGSVPAKSVGSSSRMITIAQSRTLEAELVHLVELDLTRPSFVVSFSD